MAKFISDEEFAELEQQGKVKDFIPDSAIMDAPPKPTGMQRAAGLTDAFFGGGKVGEAIGTAIAQGKLGKTVQKAVVGRDLSPDAEARVTPGPSAGAIAGSALQSAALFAPVGRIATGITGAARTAGLQKGASAIGKIGSGAATGELFDISLNLQEGKTGGDVFTPGAGALIGGAIPGVGVAKNAAVRFGNDQAPRIINSLIKPLAKDFSYGKDPGRAVAELKIVAGDFDELATKINQARQTTGQEIGALGRKLSTAPVVSLVDSLSPLDDAMRTAAEQNNSTLLSRLQSVKQAINTKLEPGVDDAGNIIIKEAGARKLDGLTFSEARDVLRQVGDITQFTGNPSDDKAVNSALKAVYGEIKERTLDAADGVNPELAKDFRKLTERYSDLTSAEIATKYRDKIVQRSNLSGLSPQMAGFGTAILTFVASGGSALPAVLLGVGAGVLDKLAASPGFKTRLAAVLSKKSPEQVNALFRTFPALQKFFPKGGAISPGDRLLETKAAQAIGTEVKKSLNNAPGLSMRDVTKYDDSGRLIPSATGKNAAATAKSGAWPTTASKTSKAGNTSTGSALTERGGVSARKADTSVPFEGGVLRDGPDSLVKSMTRQELRDIITGHIKQDRPDLINPDGTVTLYHGTQSADAINESGAFKSGTYFAADRSLVEKNYSGQSASKAGKFTIMEVKADPADLDYKGDGVFTARTGEIKPSSPSIPKELAPLAKEARNRDLEGFSLNVETGGFGKQTEQTLIQFHSAPEKLTGELRPSTRGTLGAGFYLTQTKEKARRFTRQTKQLDGSGVQRGEGVTANITAFDTSKLKFKMVSDKMDFLEEAQKATSINDPDKAVAEYRRLLLSEGFDGVELFNRGETVVFPESINRLNPIDLTDFYNKVTGGRGKQQ